jgi:uncharacterized protein YdaU (DUF1376 family)
MNYYEHHIGDYAEATAHLSFIEDAAYSRMIRKYYAMEGPLPADLRVVQRLICARSEDEREAVEIVLGEFFTLRDDGYHNARCDEEIAQYREKQEKARRSANARWNKGKQQSDGDANGGNAALPPQYERNTNASADTCERIKSECEGNAHQSPDTNTQEPYGSFVRVAHEAQDNSRTTAPADMQPERTHAALAKNLNLDVHAELAKFLDYHRAEGSTYVDWNAAFSKWLRTARQFGSGKDQQRKPQQSRQDAIASACDTLGVGSQYLNQEPAHALR